MIGSYSGISRNQGQNKENFYKKKRSVTLFFNKYTLVIKY